MRRDDFIESRIGNDCEGYDELYNYILGATSLIASKKLADLAMHRDASLEFRRLLGSFVGAEQYLDKDLIRAADKIKYFKRLDSNFSYLNDFLLICYAAAFIVILSSDMGDQKDAAILSMAAISILSQSTLSFCSAYNGYKYSMMSRYLQQTITALEVLALNLRGDMVTMERHEARHRLVPNDFESSGVSELSGNRATLLNIAACLSNIFITVTRFDFTNITNGSTPNVPISALSIIAPLLSAMSKTSSIIDAVKLADLRAEKIKSVFEDMNENLWNYRARADIANNRHNIIKRIHYHSIDAINFDYSGFEVDRGLEKFKQLVHLSAQRIYSTPYSLYSMFFNSIKQDTLVVITDGLIDANNKHGTIMIDSGAQSSMETGRSRGNQYRVVNMPTLWNLDGSQFPSNSYNTSFQNSGVEMRRYGNLRSNTFFTDSPPHNLAASTSIGSQARNLGGQPSGMIDSSGHSVQGPFFPVQTFGSATLLPFEPQAPRNTIRNSSSGSYMAQLSSPTVSSRATGALGADSFERRL